MEFANPFSAPGTWFKGNLHTHTTVSDGSRTPETTAQAYREAGYDFLALSDHMKVTVIENGRKIQKTLCAKCIRTMAKTD